jgi:hypothetical protein
MHQQRTARESHGADTGVLPRIASTTALLLLRRRRRRPVVLATTLAVAALVVALLRRPVSTLSIALRRRRSPVALLGRWWATSIRAVAWRWCAVLLLLLLLLAAVSWPGVVECALACVLVDEEPAALSTLPLGVPWWRNGGWALMVVLRLSPVLLLPPVLLLSSVLLLSVLLLLAVLLLLLLLLLATTSKLRDEVLEEGHGVVICYVIFRPRIRLVSKDLKRGEEQQQTQKPSQRLNKKHDKAKGNQLAPRRMDAAFFSVPVVPFRSPPSPLFRGRSWIRLDRFELRRDNTDMPAARSSAGLDLSTGSPRPPTDIAGFTTSAT